MRLRLGDFAIGLERPAPAPASVDDGWIAPSAATGILTTATAVVVAALLLRRRARRSLRSHRYSNEQDDLDFLLACKWVREARATLSMKDRLRLYSFYKQATCGDAPHAEPEWYSVVDSTKHASWSRRRGMQEGEARTRYVTVVDELSEHSWRGGSAGTVPAVPAAWMSVGGSVLAAIEGGAPNGDADAKASAPEAASERALRERIVELEMRLAQLTQQSIRGYLHRYQPHSASWLGSSHGSWERRFFQLVREQLLCYRGEADATPRRTIPLANCVVVDEGLKVSRRQSYRVFSLWMVGTLDSARGPGSGALIRLSCASSTDECERWLSALQAATLQPMRTLDARSGRVDSPVPTPRRQLSISPSPSAIRALDSLDAPHSAAAGRPGPLAHASTTHHDAPADGARTVDGEPGSDAAAPTEQSRGAPAESPARMRRSKAPFDPDLFPASRPMHHSARPSLLSAGGMSSDTNMAGFINLIFLLFVVTNARLLLENILKYGLLVPIPRPALPSIDAATAIGPQSMSWLHESFWRWVRTVTAVVVPCLAAYAIERAAVRTTPLSRYSRKLVDKLHVLNGLASLTLPCALITWDGHAGGIGGAIVLLLIAVTVFLKLVSWAHVHHDFRMAEKESSEVLTETDGSDLDAKLAKFSTHIADTEGDSVHYPSNVTLPNLGYFLLAPTLCYQTDFPRTPRIRKSYLLSLTIRLVVLWTLIPAFVVQYMLPTLRNSTQPIRDGDMLQIVERMMKLALPVTYTWLTGFYAFFHVWLNFLAELLRFGDRVFYKAWWNATDFEGYWRTWNMPVHCWIVRHAYFPIQRHLTRSKTMTGVLCFTISAALHEVVVAFPLRSFSMPLAFVGMMSQVPMLPLSSWLKRKTRGTTFEPAGNYLFWITFCFLGQPAAVLLYYSHATLGWADES